MKINYDKEGNMKNKKKFTINGGIVFALLAIVILVHFPAPLAGQEYVDIIGGKRFDVGHCIVYDEPEESFVIVGQTKSFGYGKFDAFIAKYRHTATAPFLNLLWARVIGTEHFDSATCVVIHGDFYVLCGVVYKPDSSKHDILLAKYSKAGEPIFAKTYDAMGMNKTDLAQTLIVDSHGNYVVVGTTTCADDMTDILVAKFDSVGGCTAAATIGSPGIIDIGSTIIEDFSGNYVLAGYTGNQRDIVMVRLDPAFTTTLNSIRLHLSNNGLDFPWAIIRETDPTGARFFVVAGRTTNQYGDDYRPDLLLFKINDTLTAVPWITYLKNAARGEVARSLIKSGLEYVVAGFSQDLLVDPRISDALFVKFDGGGNPLLTRITNLPEGYDFTRAYGMTEAPDDYYVATGLTDSPAGSTSELGRREILAASYIWTSPNCYISVERDAVNPHVIFNPYSPRITCNMVEGTVHQKGVLPKIKNICE
jgi:hypothetical protein